MLRNPEYRSIQLQGAVICGLQSPSSSPVLQEKTFTSPLFAKGENGGLQPPLFFYEAALRAGHAAQTLTDHSIPAYQHLSMKNPAWRYNRPPALPHPVSVLDFMQLSGVYSAQQGDFHTHLFFERLT